MMAVTVVVVVLVRLVEIMSTSFFAGNRFCTRRQDFELRLTILPFL